MVCWMPLQAAPNGSNSLLGIDQVEPAVIEEPMMSLAHVVEVGRREGQGKAVQPCDSLQLSISGELLKRDARLA